MFSQTNTTNKSFIRQWRFLQNKEIENNIFMLKTENDTLKEIENARPYSTEMEKLISGTENDARIHDAVTKEIAANPWYAFREGFIIPSDVAYNMHYYAISEPFMLSQGTLRLLYGYINRINTSFTHGTENSFYGKETLYLMYLYALLIHGYTIHSIPILFDLTLETQEYIAETTHFFRKLIDANLEILNLFSPDDSLASLITGVIRIGSAKTDQMLKDYPTLETLYEYLITGYRKDYITDITDTSKRKFTFFVNRDDALLYSKDERVAKQARKLLDTIYYAGFNDSNVTIIENRTRYNERNVPEPDLSDTMIYKEVPESEFYHPAFKHRYDGFFMYQYKI